MSWQSAIPTINLVLAALEIVLLLVAVYLTIAQFRRSRASSYIERFNSTDMLANRVAVDRWLDATPGSRARLDAFEADHHLGGQIRQFVNLFQELGTAYQYRIAHRKSVEVLFDSLVIMYWERLHFLVEHLRARTDPTLWSRFEWLYHRMSRLAGPPTEAVTWVLGYGSLMDPRSTSQALGRTICDADLVPATLQGYTRSWTVGDRVRSESLDRELTALFLDATERSGTNMNATLVAVSNRELSRLERREKNYRLVNVTDAVRLSGGARPGPRARVVTFVGREECRIDSGAEAGEIMVPRRYVEFMTRVARSLGEPVMTEMEAAVGQVSGVPGLDGAYVFVDSEQRKLV